MGRDDGSDAEADCIECVVGRYLEGTGSSEVGSCLACPVKWSDAVGAGSASDCIACGAGKYATTSANVLESSCIVCISGDMG